MPSNVNDRDGISGPGATRPGSRRLNEVRRTMYRYLVLAGIVAVGMSLLFAVLSGDPGSNLIMDPLLLLGLVLAEREFLRPGGRTRMGEAAVLVMAIANLLGNLGINLVTASDAATHEQAWSAFATWAPLVYVLAYLAWGRSGGLRLSVGFYALTVAVLAVYAWLGSAPFMGMEWLALTPFYVASLLYVPLLHAFSYFVEWHARELVASEIRADLATLDPLTGLPNRLRFFDRLERAIALGHRTGSTFAVYFVDLDGFKRVNDTHGHQMGDDLLIEVARRLQAALRESDTVARIGGDEFTVLTSPLKTEEGADVVANKLLEACTPPMVLNGRELDVGCSIGVARYPADGQSADQLVARADAAMYEAKQQGGHAVRFAAQATAR